MVTEIQVSGLNFFSGNRWREAILFYLFGIWGNADRVTYRPKMNFGDFTLRLDSERHSYWVDTRRVKRTSVSLAFVLPRYGEIVVGSDQNDVEIALAKFVKNDAITSLVIQLEEGNVYLRKVQGIRGQLEAVILLKAAD